jgi:AcrR family transcriptional regulator
VNETAEPHRKPDFAPIGDDDACLHWLWTVLHAPDGASAVCKHCRTMRRFHRVARRRAYACDSCGTQVYPTAGTFMQGSRLSVATWFSAATLVKNSEGRIAAGTLASDLGVGHATALRVKRKLAGAMSGGGADAALLEKIWLVATETDALSAESAQAREGSFRARENIRAAACRAFAARGQSATRIADIAREAGVSSAIIHYYYKSKDEVLLAALQWADEQTIRRWEQLREHTTDPIQLLRKTLEMAVPSEGVLHDEYLLWIETWARVRFQPHLLAECVAMSDRWAVFLNEVIEGGCRAGVFHPVVPPPLIVQRLVALSDGLAFRSAVGYSSMRVRRVSELLLAFAAEQVGVPVEELTGRGDERS